MDAPTRTGGEAMMRRAVSWAGFLVIAALFLARVPDLGLAGLLVVAVLLFLFMPSS